MSENIGFIERLKRRILPVAAVGMLALAGCADDKESGTVGDQVTALHAEATELCTADAQARFEAEYPDVEISDSPTLAELQDAVTILKAKESEGPDFIQGEYDVCMKREFDDVVAGLDNGTIVPQDTVVVTETSIAG